MRKNYTTSQRVMSVYLLWRVYCGITLLPGSLATPSVTAWALLGFALRDSAAVRPRHTRGAHEGAARSRVGPREYVAPAAPSDPERR